MNKTVTVNLGGTVFHIDDNAYESLIKYLNAIKSRFSADQGRDEIMQDIESRIGEMFRDRMKDGRQVITLNDVNEVTGIMGRPEEFEGDDGKGASPGDAASIHGVTQTGPVKKRFFRNPDDKLIGGVCSGISSYFDIDPIYVRLAFAAALLLYGSGFWLYILLWIIMPEAKTTADRLMMKGEPVTVSNIEKNVKEELETLKARVSESAKPKTFVGRFFEGVGEVFKFIFLAIGKIILVFFVIIGLIVGMSLFASLFGLVGAPFVHFPGFLLHMFNSGGQFGWIYFGAVLVIAIPFLMIAYAGIRSLFNLKKGSRIVGMSALGLWIMGILIVLFSGMSVFLEFSEGDSFRKEIPLQQPAGKLLVLETDETKNSEADYKYGRKYSRNIDEDFYLESSGDKLVSKNVQLDVVKSPTESFELVEIFYAQGGSRKTAIDNASRISYSFTQKDSVLRFDRFFTLDNDDKWRAQKVQLLLRMPIGSRVRLDNSLRNFIYDIDNLKNIHDDYMVNRTWEMTERGLVCVDCDGTEHSIDGEFMEEEGGNAKVNIDDHGVRIISEDGDKVTIDSTGIHVRQGGKDVLKIDKDGVRIDTEEKKNR